MNYYHQQLPRHQRTEYIMRLLYDSYASNLKHANPDVFAALALKIERILLRSFPNDVDIPPQVLEAQMRHVIERILFSKETVALQPNNYTVDELLYEV
ncbi:unnamed protein product [Aphanomyces euteiches]|uniref:Uncharacterized protein n=1 Tax=Aphanomyces euteiches TaxID=100861 RepID=A0A6G0WQI4_9STRA|nr:hypothetical protein Ae201684_012707 [Aphanomyces euteiches]KAH9095605.1 hypothetical protein Ae201684P_015406 [Aphanomyces euteiches]KAH9105268.1 hypothetical protein AeMF1_018854 [Aphanomyces euteiches]KAH9119101.1 hypothetical protein LEN26_011797 [Aphanomyces euteiches]KAH9131332.1 hypothetical protein AeNC1_019710 [Aphanomyces euteiches]